MAGGDTDGGVKMTPMMQQYQAMRRQLPDDVLLLFRLGDFYEMFFEDAKIASPILNVALTKRNGMPMCGVPHHAAEGYLAKLIRAGKRVALAEQTTEPQPGKIVEREISQIISAGTIDDLNLLDSARPNYLAAVLRGKGRYGLAFVEHSTGEFRLTEFADRESLSEDSQGTQDFQEANSKGQAPRISMPRDRPHGFPCARDTPHLQGTGPTQQMPAAFDELLTWYHEKTVRRRRASPKGVARATPPTGSLANESRATVPAAF